MQRLGRINGFKYYHCKALKLNWSRVSNGICSILAKKIIDIESGRSKAIIEVNSLKDSRDFLDVRDAVKAYHVLLRDGINGKQYNIGSGVKRSLLDVLEQYKELTQLNFL